MKKLTVLLLTGVMVLSLVACGSKKEDDTQNQTPSTEVSDTIESVEDSVEDTEDNTGTEIDGATEGNVSEIGSSDDPVAVLSSAWNLFEEENRFPAAGGDFSEENNKMDEPSVYSLEDAEAVDAALGLPADVLDKVDSAASLMHMMNANTFTGAAFHVADEADVMDVINALDTHISERQWMCGFPDKLVIIRVDNTVVSMFGKTDNIENFKNKLMEAYPNASVEVEKDIL